MSREFIDDLYIVKARATMPDGRTDEALGAVPLGSSVKGETRANAIMKGETKAKRRVTLSICGLGVLDETEAEPRPRRGPWRFADPAHEKVETDSQQLEAGNPGADECAEVGKPTLFDRIEAATNEADLKLLGPECAAAPDSDKAALKAAYGARLTYLRQQADEETVI